MEHLSHCDKYMNKCKSINVLFKSVITLEKPDIIMGETELDCILYRKAAPPLVE